jgi:hypothetical protein
MNKTHPTAQAIDGYALVFAYGNAAVEMMFQQQICSYSDDLRTQKSLEILGEVHSRSQYILSYLYCLLYMIK